MTFNVHGNKTSNGVTIVKGLKVLNYDYVEGVVLSDDHEREYMCNCAHQHDNDLTEDFRISGGTCKTNCRHDHWFNVETQSGTKSFNGSRLKAI